MIPLLLIAVVILGGALTLMYFIMQRSEKDLILARQQAEAAHQQRQEEVARVLNETQALIAESVRVQHHYESEAVRACEVANEKVARARAEAQAAFDQKVAEQNTESERVRQHYESEALKACEGANQKIAEQNVETERVRKHYESEAVKAYEVANEKIARARAEAQTAMANAQAAFEQKSDELDAAAERIREHYETEARKALEQANAQLAKTLAELEPLRGYASLKDAETEVRKALAGALEEATALRQEAQTLMEQTRSSAEEERQQARQRAREIRDQAETLLTQATRDAGRIVSEAEKRAEEIGGDAYVALRDKELLEHAARAIRNVVEGYGDRYIIPTHSLLDELAEDFGYTAAGEALKAAREQSRRMAGQGEAATCDYAETNRRETAIRFVIDAFNGRVDATLSTVRHNNHGTLEQQIRDTYSLVNLNGEAFRNARILPAYLDSRLAELKWAVVAQELKLKEREEQRRIQEQMREEEKVRREQEQAIKEAQDQEDAIESALVKARLEAEHATAQERAKFDAQIAELSHQLAEAVAVKQRELSMAQLTRAGNVYIISNIGSFGEEVFKIGMTRRRDPMDRVWELSDASVPFDYDVHAMIQTDDAPALEGMLHDAFDDLRINKVNARKEFFRLPLDRIRALTAEKGFNVTFTMAAEAREYRETMALEKMTPTEREKYHLRKAETEENGEE